MAGSVDHFDNTSMPDNRASNGGKMEVKPIPYSPPVGPTNMYHEGPGLANHTNHGNCGTQGKR